MARAGTTILDSGERFPTLTVETVAHGPLTLPDHFGEHWGVLLIYRAHW
jgi:alkyl hydroperoxide reductase subunit AhpC